MRLALAITAVSIAFSGCESAPASASALNTSAARSLLLQFAEYTDKNGHLPRSIYSFYPHNWDEHRLRSLRFCNYDRSSYSDFLYFPPELGEVTNQEPVIVFASPTVAKPGEQRIVVRADLSIDWIDEASFRNEIEAAKNAEQAGGGSTPISPRVESDSSDAVGSD